MVMTMTKGDIAKNNFQNGCNCAQAVLLAFCEDYGMEKDDTALYSEMIPGGYVNVTRNPEGLDSKVSIEVLFNTVMKNKQTIKQLFN